MRYPFLTIATVLAALSVPGCKPADRVSYYRVEKIAQPAPTARPAAAARTDGMLAAIVPHEAQAWFFKLTGPVEAVAATGEPFRKFVQSIHFDGEKPAYDPPAEWQAEGGNAFRYETFRVPSAAGPLELTVTQLANPADEESLLLPNINRWRGQLGLTPIAASEIGENSKQLQLPGGLSATLVVLVGHLSGGNMSPPIANAPRENESPSAAADGMLAAVVPHDREGWFFKLTGPAPAVADQREAFGKFIASVHFDEGEPRYAAPADWQAQGSAGMRYETFSIPSAGGSLQLAVTRLVKPPGDEQTYVVANINRWRGQMSLPDLNSAQLAENSTDVKLSGGETATIVDLVGKLKPGGMAPPAAAGGPNGQ